MNEDNNTEDNIEDSRNEDGHLADNNVEEAGAAPSDQPAAETPASQDAPAPPASEATGPTEEAGDEPEVSPEPAPEAEAEPEAEEAPVATAVANAVGVRFQNSGKTYCFDGGELMLRVGDRVVVESELGINIGSVAKIHCDVKSGPDKLKPILRKVTEVDLTQEEENDGVKREAREYAIERIEERKLPMKLLYTDVTLDRKRFIFYFTADTRIDFRELVKDLAGKFRTRIELRQIGVRDAARMIGGFGVCGQELCCKTWLKSFAPISIKMAKQQDLVLNTCKLSGLCGRLMCCLNYEYDPDAKKRRRQEEREAREAAAAMAAEAEAPADDASAMLEAGRAAEEALEKYLVENNVESAPAESAPAAGAPSDDQEQRRKKKRRRGGRKRHDKSGDRGGPRPDAQSDKAQGDRAQGERAPRDAGKKTEGRDASASQGTAQGDSSDKPRPDGQKKRRPRRRRRKPRGGGGTGSSGGNGSGGGGS